jgi:hypothetical protein
MRSESAFEKVRPQRPNELIDGAGFRWYAAAGGYRWVDQKEVYPRAFRPDGLVRDRVLVPSEPIRSGVRVKKPQEESRLFVTFANTPADEGGLLGFANQWGYLRSEFLPKLQAFWVVGNLWSDGWPYADTAPAELPVARGGDRVIVPVERLSLWRREVAAMKGVLDFWEMASGHERNLIAGMLRDIIFGSPPGRSGAIGSPGGGERGVPCRAIASLRLCIDQLLPEGDQRLFRAHVPECLRYLALARVSGPKAGEPGADPVAVSLMKGLDRELASAPQGVIAVALRWVQEEIDGHLRKETHACLNWDVRHNRAVMGLTPGTLSGALWLQFAQVVTGQASHRPCKACGKWLTLSNDDYGFRSDRVFCSAACRQKDYRAKIREARRLRAEGQTVRQIAKRFDTTTETIQNWLTKEK